MRVQLVQVALKSAAAVRAGKGGVEAGQGSHYPLDSHNFFIMRNSRSLQAACLVEDGCVKHRVAAVHHVVIHRHNHKGWVGHNAAELRAVEG